MKKVYEGKTKTVYELPDGNFQLFFKDDMTGENGKFDPGANTVGLSVQGAGAAGLAMSAYFFGLLESKGCPTHFISAEPDKCTMTVRPAEAFGNGLEVICRYKAMGSFIRRYGDYVEEGAALDALVEMTLKDDLRGDPLATEDTLVALGVLKPGEYAVLKEQTQNICAIIKAALAEKGMGLCDIKLEFGRGAGGIMLMDEISGGNMRVLDNGKPVEPLELAGRCIS